MGRFNYFRAFITGFLLLLLQVLVLKDIVLFEDGFCFAYILILLLIPIDTSRTVQLFVGFLVGLLMDSFYLTFGIHAAACTLLMFVRPYWLRIMTPSGGYDTGAKINIHNQGFQWFVSYILPLIWIHSLTLFAIEISKWKLLGQIITRSFYSAIFTLIIVLIIQYLFYKKPK